MADSDKAPQPQPQPQQQQQSEQPPQPQQAKAAKQKQVIGECHCAILFPYVPVFLEHMASEAWISEYWDVPSARDLRNLFYDGFLRI